MMIRVGEGGLIQLGGGLIQLGPDVVMDVGEGAGGGVRDYYSGLTRTITPCTLILQLSG